MPSPRGAGGSSRRLPPAPPRPEPPVPPRVHTLADGHRIVVRAVVEDDREQLTEGYNALSLRSRRARFGSAAGELSTNQLDQLLDLDYDDRLALAAIAVDRPGAPGVGVARYVRSHDNPAEAEVAIVVRDDDQDRGIGSILLDDLAAAARDRGITTFTASVMWDNARLLDAARSAGALVAPAEPGVATVRFQLPAPSDGDSRASLHARR